MKTKLQVKRAIWELKKFIIVTISSMARRRVRKRVYAIPRAPDGSAFFICEKCGVSVAISLTDMHFCESNKIQFKYFQPEPAPEFKDQTRSPYRLFMESFSKGKEMESYIEVERLGFQMWQNMSKEDKLPFVSHAKLLDYRHQRALKHEADEIIKPQGTLENSQKTQKHKFLYTDHGVYFAGYLVVNYHKLGITRGEI
ncbi:hypothetical protein KIW84_012417 [Lathyrus oleraceus]|uniref:HMG box domain-containing protein n=1 Tax=Pisum sativum TaxID=3888 RepID=A0A9D5BHI5_PEA|nr:hypothetical protein KIW84_012417 [Pisum sativum]